jgi:hypothetical protein
LAGGVVASGIGVVAASGVMGVVGIGVVGIGMGDIGLGDIGPGDSGSVGNVGAGVVGTVGSGVETVAELVLHGGHCQGPDGLAGSRAWAASSSHSTMHAVVTNRNDNSSIVV